MRYYRIQEVKSYINACITAYVLIIYFLVQNMRFYRVFTALILKHVKNAVLPRYTRLFEVNLSYSAMVLSGINAVKPHFYHVLHKEAVKTR